MQSVGYVIISYFSPTKHALGRTSFLVNRLLPKGRHPRGTIKSPDKEDDQDYRMVVAPNGKLKRISTSRQELDVDKIVEQLMRFYPFLLCAQVQTSGGVASWRNVSLLQAMEAKEQLAIPEEHRLVVAQELRAFPKTRIDLRL